MSEIEYPRCPHDGMVMDMADYDGEVWHCPKCDYEIAVEKELAR